MTTPAFSPQTPDSLTEVRFFTPFDPYYYEVDNRPLTDLETNINAVASKGSDSGRRATLLTQLSMSDLFRNLASGQTNFVSGLKVSSPSSNVIRIGPGSYYESQDINSDTGTNVLKQAILLESVDIPATPPGSAGQSIDYLVQIRFKTLIGSNMAGSALPFLDPTNPLLEGLLLNGELEISSKTGAAANTGSQVTPTADSGWVALYVVTATNGSTNPYIRYDNADWLGRSKGVFSPTLGVPSANPATVVEVGGCPSYQFATSALNKVTMAVPLDVAGFNPLDSLKVKISYSSPVNTGDAQISLGYVVLLDGSSTTTSVTTSPQESLTVPGTASTITTGVMTAEVPCSAFAGFISGDWSITAVKMYLTINRHGASGSDTVSGNLIIHGVTVFQ